MKHLTALAIKFVMIAAVLLVVLWLLAGQRLIPVLVLSLVVTILAYVIGDLLILPTFGNVVATVADIVISSLTIWAARVIGISGLRPALWAITLSALIIGVGEWFFHQYLKDKVLPGPIRSGTSK